MNEKIDALVNELNEASDAYYNGNEIMSNFEFDEKMETLKKLEEETGIILPNSPTVNVGAPVKVSALKKVRHKYPALSLDKTKDIDKFVSAFKKAPKTDTVLMWKMDGSTINLLYENGKLTLASTRGDGEVGQDITHNAPYIKGVPQIIPYTLNPVYVRGEAVMSYTEFDNINKDIDDSEKYANPRNLANASVSMLDSMEMRKRTIQFFAFSLVNFADMDNMTFEERLNWMESQGIQVVEHQKCSIDTMKDTMNLWGEEKIKTFDYPVDGLVAALNDAPYADKLPGTGHNPHILAGYAFKWQDESADTVLKEIEWSAGRTGVLTPVAVFEPVSLEGTVVTRASLHNFSFMRKMKLRIGNRISIIKANKIIPQVVKNLDDSKPYEDDEILTLAGNTCPICGSPVIIQNDNGIETVHCPNNDCAAKKIRAFTHFGERDCMNLTGMSDAIITKFVEKGYLKEFADFYKLDRYKDEIVVMDGFGEKSWENIWKSIQNSRHIDFIPFIHALGIPNIGKGQAKLLYRHFDKSFEKFLLEVLKEEDYDYTAIDGFGDILNESLNNWVHYMLAPMIPSSKSRTFDDKQMEMVHLFEYVSVNENNDVQDASNALNGKTFVITGSVLHFPNRDAIKKFIEDNGGKTSGSVSSKTSYLVNNDITSTSGKNKKAKELGIPIISEEMLLEMVNTK